jgi:hypothetical protein
MWVAPSRPTTKSCKATVATDVTDSLDIRGGVGIIFPMTTNITASAARKQTAELYGEVGAFLDRFIVFAKPSQRTAVAWWTMHTWAFDAAYTTPYLYITSAEPGSGKTRVLDTVKLLSRSPLSAANTTIAAMFRRIEVDRPTLLIDEVDTIFNGAKNEELRGTLNSGYKQGGTLSRFVGKDVEDYSTFCPKLLAGLDNGAMPDTLADRCIKVVLKKKRPGDNVERLIARKVEPDAEALTAKVKAWAIANMDRLMDAPEPEYIDGLSDRAMEIAEPLMMLAWLGGKKLADECREAMTDLLTGQKPQASEGIRALTAARELFDTTDRIPSAMLAEAVHMTAKQLGVILARYEITPSTIRFTDGTKLKGYYARDFADAFDRYLDPAEGEDDN